LTTIIQANIWSAILDSVPLIMTPFKTVHDSLHNIEPSKNKILLSSLRLKGEVPNL